MDKIAICIGKVKYTRDDLKIKLKEFQIPFLPTDKKADLVKKLNLYLDSLTTPKQKKTSRITKTPKKPKVTKKAIPKVMRIAVWDKYIGSDQRKGSCHVCKKEILIEMFECGHIVAESTGGETTLENLRPLCSLCNKSMQTRNMNDFLTDYNAITSDSSPNNSDSSPNNSDSNPNNSDFSQTIDSPVNDNISSNENIIDNVPNVDNIANNLIIHTDSDVINNAITLMSNFFDKLVKSNEKSYVARKLDEINNALQVNCQNMIPTNMHPNSCESQLENFITNQHPNTLIETIGDLSEDSIDRQTKWYYEIKHQFKNAILGSILAANIIIASFK